MIANDRPPLDYDGERMVPERAHARTFWEHVGRYRFARRHAAGRRVLDVACGEGYGAAALAKAGAREVVGVDLSEAACAHARRKYGLDARAGDAQCLPLSDRSVDLVVSFETIEHVARPAAFLDECARVLGPAGTLIVSTPNRPVYSGDGASNPFHVVEFDRGEFLAALAGRFEDVALYTQFPRSAGWWSPRSLAAERSPWLRVKGFWRLASTLCPALRAEVPAGLRGSAVDLILRDPPAVSAPFDPFIVRPYRESSREQPYYFVAVAGRARPFAGASR